MTKYNIKVTSSVIIEADTPDQAKREFLARREQLADMGAKQYEHENDLLLNAQVESIEVEPERDEYDAQID